VSTTCDSLISAGTIHGLMQSACTLTYILSTDSSQSIFDNSLFVMTDDRTCEFCGSTFNKFGIGSHRKKCERAYNDVVRDTLYHARGFGAHSAGPSRLLGRL
jgi:hypothetical protein